jgi:hypothetical protein
MSGMANWGPWSLCLALDRWPRRVDIPYRLAYSLIYTLSLRLSQGMSDYERRKDERRRVT